MNVAALSNLSIESSVKSYAKHLNHLLIQLPTRLSDPDVILARSEGVEQDQMFRVMWHHIPHSSVQRQRGSVGKNTVQSFLTRSYHS